MEIIIVPGNRRGSTYYTCNSDKGFLYRTNKTKNGIKFLICVEKGCPARASANELLFTKLGEHHNHLPDTKKEEALRLKVSMLAAAINTSEDIKSIFVSESARVAVDAAAKLAFPSMSKSMRRYRKFNQPAMPTSLQNFGVACEENLRFGKIDGRRFCRGVVGEGEFVSVLFLAEDLEHLFSEATEIHLDGTFKTRPRKPDSSQLLTILVVRYGIAFPCAFALMSSRKIEAYNMVFSKIKQIIPEFRPNLIMTDFEASLVRSLREHFPNARKTGCFFHYCQAVMKQAGILGMKSLLRNNLSAKKAMKMLLCLPLLPAENIVEGTHRIRVFLRQNRLYEEFETIMRYHERQWICRVGIDSMSVYNRKRRTNNDSESFHASLVRMLRVRGPNVWQFTEALRNISAETVRELRAFVNEGLQIRVLGKRKYRSNNKRIQTATEQLIENGDVGAFLDMVCCSVEALIQGNLADFNETEEEQEAEHQLLLPLDGDVPPEYQEAPGNNEEGSSSEDDEPAGAAALPAALPAVPLEHPQLGLDYDSADEEIFHLPEDDYEQLPLEAFEILAEEEETPNPFRGVGYDEELDETLPEGEACPICTGRKKMYALVNCGHLLCGYCTTQSYNPLNIFSRCPTCTTSIAIQPIRIFL